MRPRRPLAVVLDLLEHGDPRQRGGRSFAVVAVAATHRRQGIGFTLLRATHDALVGIGADKLLVTFKRGPKAAEVDGIMRRLGFSLWRKQPSYWREQCNRGEFKCVDRQDRCVCEAMLFRKAVY